LPKNANPPTNPTSSADRVRRPYSDQNIRAVPTKMRGHQPRAGNAAAFAKPESAATSMAAVSGSGRESQPGTTPGRGGRLGRTRQA